MFMLLPMSVMVLSLNTIVFIVVGTPILLLFVVVVILNVMQSNEKAVKYLPSVLKDWAFLPEPLRSLDPYDRYDIERDGKIRSKVVTITFCQDPH